MFRGYPSPSRKTTYTPNQFFDVVLPHSSRDVVRLVGYMVRHTYGWCGLDGQPKEEARTFTDTELRQNAGVGRRSYPDTIMEAVAEGYVRVVSPGVYALAWTAQQTRRRTPIPDVWFDLVLPSEKRLAVIRITGTLLRRSVSRDTEGWRRVDVTASVRDLARWTNLSAAAVTSALPQVMGVHMVRVVAGRFDRNGGRTSRASVYRVRQVKDTPITADVVLPPTGDTAEPRAHRPVRRRRCRKVARRSARRRPVQRRKVARRTKVDSTKTNDVQEHHQHPRPESKPAARKTDDVVQQHHPPDWLVRALIGEGIWPREAVKLAALPTTPERLAKYLREEWPSCMERRNRAGYLAAYLRGEVTLPSEERQRREADAQRIHPPSVVIVETAPSEPLATLDEIRQEHEALTLAGDAGALMMREFRARRNAAAAAPPAE